MPGMEKFVEFWGGIWEQNERTTNMLWMEEVKEELRDGTWHRWDPKSFGGKSLFWLRRH